MRLPTSRDEQAAYWHLKLQELDVSAEDIQSALDWQTDPENRAALERVAAYWNAWPSKPPSHVVAEPSRVWRRLWPRAAAAALIGISVLGGIALLSNRHAGRISVNEYQTQVGQVQTVVLADGTRVVLGGATSIHVRIVGDARHVQMSPGDALFDVVKDPKRPFTVEMPNGSARALGTRFNVHRGPEETVVTVLEGSVRVAPPDWHPGKSADLDAGAQLALAADGTVGVVRQADPSSVLSWQSGRLVFSERTLRSAVADLNRYSRTPITLEDPELGERRISGTVRIDQVDSWLKALGAVLEVDLRRGREGYVIASRPHH